MPLYACERCGFTSAAFRADAAAAHRLEYPDCAGAIRIIFQSEERDYTKAPTGHGAVSQATAAGSREAEATASDPGEAFVMREQIDVDERLRLILLGDLDIASADTLTARLAQLKAAGRAVRLDLSKLAFIDSSGVQALLVALTDARWQGWHLEVAREVSLAVERAANLVGIAQVLWPRDPTARQPRVPPAG